MADTNNSQRSPRIGLQLNVRLYIDNLEAITLTTRNISNTGLFVDWEQAISISEGQQMYVELAEALGDGETQKVLTTVVRIEKDGVALKYNEA